MSTSLLSLTLKIKIPSDNIIGEDTSPVETKSEYEVIDTSAAEVPTEEEIVAKRFP